MPKRCRKVNVGSGVGLAGRVSCIGLLLLLFLLVNPFVGSSVSALEDVAGEMDELDSGYNNLVDSEYNSNSTSTNVVTTEEIVNGDNFVDGVSDTVPDSNASVDVDSAVNSDIALLADTSTITVSFSPTSGSGSITPNTNTSGQLAQIKVLATVNVSNSGGYRVYIKSSSQNLVGTNTGYTIPGLQGSVLYNDIPLNTWGYYATEGSTIPDNAYYKAISVDTNGDKVAENTNTKITSDSKTIAISFAANIGNDKPTDSYSNPVTLSVVSDPLQVSLADISDMQSMTADHCAGTAVGTQKQLRDTRDGKYYWVGKLADGKCWMTQNLDLDLSSAPAESSTGTVKTLSSTDTDLNSKTSWTPTSGTYSKVTSSNILADDTGQRSWSLGNYRIINPTTSSSCGSGKGNAADCTAQFTAYTAPTTANNDANAHYILGNHYQWCAATAGCTNSSNQTGATFTSGEAQDSICPKGWKLPISNSTAAGSFRGLTATLAGANTKENLTIFLSSPYYFVRGGDVYQEATGLFNYAGNDGYYWSSTASSGTNSYNLRFSSTTNLGSSNTSYRRYGFSVRCIAR